ncbi:uncharacterized protein IL334_006117 [Kwoniella shivajii]|uniref:Uncharacterized protein n=1 Tax=Kwoniella shivajii TaxID=564305 RepID=A0ABZ1D5P8_9TREE|nr:hypothetical protein IL334_006117 [Kwoniella shivajii]
MEDGVPSPSSKAFASRLSKYAFSGSTSSSPSKLPSSIDAAGPSSPLKRKSSSTPIVEIFSPSKNRPKVLTTPKRTKKRKGEDNDDDDDDEYQEISTPSSSLVKQVMETPKRTNKKGKKPRAYAPPELYGHLKPVNDLLIEKLDIVFCGIK